MILLCKGLHRKTNACWPVYVLSIFHGTKQNNPSKGIAQQQEEHPYDYKEALVHADNHGQKEHL